MDMPIMEIMQRRGTHLNPPNRFLPIAVETNEYCDHGDPEQDQSLVRLKTEWFADDTQSIRLENTSPDIPFRYKASILTVVGEHGCAYCYARPYHEYLGGTPNRLRIENTRQDRCLGLASMLVSSPRMERLGAFDALGSHRSLSTDRTQYARDAQCCWRY